MHPLSLFLVIFLAAFTQSLTGFGSALVAMAVLPEMLGIQVAAPLVALVCGTLEVLLLARYHPALRLKAVWRLAVAAVIGIPLGILAVGWLDEKIVMRALGLVLSGYGLYGLFNFRLPELRHPAWAYLAGFLAGLLGGAYNTNGPPVILYGNCRRWQPDEFKANLQGFFILSSVLVIASHAFSHHLVSVVWRHFWITLPGVVLGVLSGISLDKRLNPTTFRRLVLALLVIMGIRLVLTR
jgi:uncharacterized membrane protein YfcA